MVEALSETCFLGSPIVGLATVGNSSVIPFLEKEK